jgi:hypothetical protein
MTTYTCDKCAWSGDPDISRHHMHAERCPQCNGMAHEATAYEPATPRGQSDAKNAADKVYIDGATSKGVQSGLDAMLGTDGARLRLAPRAPVVEMPVVTTIPVDVEKVLSCAIDAKLQSVIVVGRTPTGELYFALSGGSYAELLWDLTQAQRKVLGD